MALRRFTWWKGALVGAFIGTALWFASGALDGLHETPTRRALSVRRFAELARVGDKPGPDGQQLVDVRVHPTLDGKDLVTARATGGGRPDTPVEFLAPTPLSLPAVRGGTPAQTYASVRDFFDRGAPRLPYRYAWWEAPRVVAALWIAPPIVLFGVLLPLAIAVLIRAGLLPKPEPAPKKDRSKPRAPEPTPAVPVIDHTAVATQLDAVTHHLEASIARGSSDVSAARETVPSHAAASPTVQHGPAPADAPLAVEAKEPTTFERGEFYPVHRQKRAED